MADKPYDKPFSDSTGFWLPYSRVLAHARNNASGSLSHDELLDFYIEHQSAEDLRQWATDADGDGEVDEDAARANAAGSMSRADLLEFYLENQGREELLQWATDADGAFPIPF